jgi:predicted AAA+ superfamily ATPase
MDLKELNLKMHSLAIFHSLLKDDLLIRLSALLEIGSYPVLEQVKHYSAFFALLAREDADLTGALLNRVLDDENIYIRSKAQKKFVGAELENCLQNELSILQELSQITPRDITDMMDYENPLPVWKTSPADFSAAYKKRIANLPRVGYGVFSKHHMFIVQASGMVPASFPDPIRLSDLKGYSRERAAVLQNTLSLLKGGPAANVLLYGDAGTGKSSTVKAVVNEYKSEGLRLIEITKKQLCDIPQIVETLVGHPLKFILFIDDLSFDHNNDEFKALKAILEGSVSAKAPNIAVYATSNRRHLVKESFSERNGDDIHVNETIQELTSLSERFGLSVPFLKPDKELYLTIVRGLADQFGLHIEDIDGQAERYALVRGGRSPRVARQFVEHLKSLQE